MLKPILIQLTLKEIEIGIDLSLLDSIKIEWVAFNEYDKLGELEVLGKKIEIATSLAQFGEMEDADGRTRKAIPLNWIVDNYLDFTEEQKASMEASRKRQDVTLGFETASGEYIAEETDEGTEVDKPGEEEKGTEDQPEVKEIVEEEKEENIASFDDAQY